MQTWLSRKSPTAMLIGSHTVSQALPPFGKPRYRTPIWRSWRPRSSPNESVSMKEHQNRRLKSIQYTQTLYNYN
jgi:hypothetical protein